MKKLILISVYMLIASVKPLFADEGMWLLPLIEKLNYAAMQQQGLTLSSEDIYSINNSSLKDAVVIFGGGCTGEIISPDGLLLTNHHCGYSIIQNQSSLEHDYLKDGFWAMTRQEELAAPNLTVVFLENIEDVTDKILPALDSLDELARSEKVAILTEQLTDAIRDNNKYLRANVYSMFDGNSYYLFTYKVYEDVRLVGAPPSSIGKFGADTDNWMWPRHTGDFSMFRVYTDKDGNPAKYAADNIPLKPKRYFNISIAGIEKGDYTMIMGYPGSTNRYMTSWEVKQLMNVLNETRILVRGIRQEILLEDMLANPEIKIQYASKYSGSTNYWKNAIGMNRGLKRLNVVAKKETIEKEFTDFVETLENENYKSALQNIKQAISGREKEYQVLQYYNEVFRSIEISVVAGRAESYLKAMQDKKDAEFTGLEKTRLLRSSENFYKDYSMTTDIKVTKAMLKIFTEKVDKAYWPAVLVNAEKKYKGNFDAYVNNLFAKSAFTDLNKLKNALDVFKVKDLENDMALQLSLSIREKQREVIEALRPFNLQLATARRHFMAGLMQKDSLRIFYPDANFSTRLSYGNVLDYYPEDAVHYNYYTTLAGVMEKEDPANWEFVVPEKLKQLYENKDFGRYATADGKMPVCFISNNDITGGNSGSPVLNGRGELIGIAFDGNWEAMSGDVAFEPELQRSISVDIRYVLFIIEKYAGATHLIDEMTIVEK